MKVEKLFFELLQIAIGNREALSRKPTNDEWREIFNLCKKHSLYGIGYVGITQLPPSQTPDNCCLSNFLYKAITIQKLNSHITTLCEEVTKKFEDEGYWNIVLKGQSNIANYDVVHQGTSVNIGVYRTPGDIDVWLIPQKDTDPRHIIKPVINYSLDLAQKASIPTPKVRYNHVKLANIWDTEVEIHYRPSFLSSPLRNWRLQSWFKANRPIHPKLSKGIPVPSNEFNAIYQLTHIHRHLFEDGIGLRQLMDYFFVLLRTDKKHYTYINNTIEQFGMQKFTSAIMWILAHVYDPKDTDYSDANWQELWPWMLCMPNEKEGLFLLSEIMIAGNFGKYDNRIKKSNGLRLLGYTIISRPWLHALEKTKHNVRLLKHYPEEVLWEPIFRFYHFIWRTLMMWKI